MNSIPHFDQDRFPVSFIDGLSVRLTALLRDGCRLRGERLLSISVALPGYRLRASPCLRPGDFYWSAPADDRRILGRGYAWRSRAGGDARFAVLDRRLARLLPLWRHEDLDELGREPLVLTAAAFDPHDPMSGEWSAFPNAELRVPGLLLEQDDKVCRLVLSAVHPLSPRRQVADWIDQLEILMADVEPVADVSRERRPDLSLEVGDDRAWLALAERALDSIRRAELDKLVLYRHSCLSGGLLNVRQLLHGLESGYPACRLISVLEKDAEFVCASPERLLVKRGRRVFSDALAGTAPRVGRVVGGHSWPGDLRQDRKIRREQDLVRETIRRALLPYCEALADDGPPQVRPLGRLVHLHNQVSGRLRRDTSSLVLADQLHPTPAVCGSPKARALAWLRAEGQSGRGWYSGFAGWLDRNGDAELNVLIRCALLHDERVSLFAGAGLVEGSIPEDELTETELKMAALRDHLTP